MRSMTDEQFRALRTLILDVMVEIKDLAVAVRSLERRITSLEAKVGDTGPDFFAVDEMLSALKTPRSRAPRSDD